MNTDLVPLDASALEVAADPAEYVIQSCERAKAWLAQVLEHGDIEQIVEMKSRAEAIRVYTMSKQLGRDAELSAAEIVRRAERGIGLAVRKGQAAGQIKRRQRHGDIDNNSISPKQYVGGGQTAYDTYAMTDSVSDEQFEAAIDAAKAEGNLSRSNVIRQVRDPGSPAPARGRPAGRNRRPLPEAFRDAAYDLAKAAERVARLAEDDRFPRNAEQVARTCRHDLLRTSELLATVIGRFQQPTTEDSE